MGWNADGTFSRSYDWTDERDAGNNIDATKFDTENDTFATGIESCINKDGKNSPSTDLPMAGNKHTGVGDGSARNHYAALGQIQDGAGVWGGTAGGTATALTITPSPAITAYATGQTFSFLAASTNTGSTTINVNSVGAKSVYSGGTTCIGGEIVSGQTYVITYDGTQFHLIGHQKPSCAVAVYKSGTQAIPTGANTLITWDSERYDYASMHSISSNTSRLVAPVTGIYHVTLTIQWEANTTGSRMASIYHVPTTSIRGKSDSPADPTFGKSTNCASADVELSASQYVDAYVEQASGGNLNVETNSYFTMHLVMRT